MISIKRYYIKDYSDLIPLRDRWGQVWNRTNHRLPSTTWEWIASWWDSLRQSSSLLILELIARENTIGFVPLTIDQPNTILPKRVQIAAAGTFDYQDLPIVSDYQELAVRAVAGFLATEMDWDVIELAQLVWSPALIKNWTEPFQEQGHRVETFTSPCTWKLSLEPTWDLYISQLGKSWRETIRQEVRRIRKEGGIFARALTKDEALQFLKSLFELRLSDDARNSLLAVQITQDPYYRFHSAIIPFLLQSGLVNLHALLLDGVALAVVYELVCPEGLLYYLTGYHTQWRSKSPGTVLAAHCIEVAIQGGYLTYDFGRGDEDYKKRWRAQPLQTRGIRTISNGKSTRLFLFNERLGRKLNGIQSNWQRKLEGIEHAREHP